MTADGYLDTARRAAAWMAEQVAGRMRTMLVLLALAVFATRVRQNHRRVGWLLIATAVALVTRQHILSVAVVAVRAGPSVEGAHEFDGATLFSLLAVVGGFFGSLVVRNLLLFLSVVCIGWVTLSCRGSCVLFRVEPTNPSLDAAQMERLAALLAVPDGASLEDHVGADGTLLLARGQGLHKVAALLCQVL